MLFPLTCVYAKYNLKGTKMIIQKNSIALNFVAPITYSIIENTLT